LASQPKRNFHKEELRVGLNKDGRGSVDGGGGEERQGKVPIAHMAEKTGRNA